MLPLHKQGWKWPSHPSHLLTLCLMLTGSMTVRSYEDEKCYCVSEENETIRQAIADFTDTPSVSKYEYIGARYNSTADGFDPCVCDDVVCVLSELTVTEQYVLELAAKDETELNDNVTKALDAAAKAAFKRNVALTHVYLSSFATYKETNDSKVIFNVEFIVKGTDTIIKDKVAVVMLEAVAGNTLDGLGSVQNFTKKFSLRTCPEGPDGGENTQASFTKNVAGTSVTITCKAGYRTNPGEATRGRSKCSHETLTWTPPSPNITCVEDKRCYRNPPNPINTRRKWDGQKEEGTEIVYNCRILYKTLTDEKSIYRCENKVWTLVTSEIKCDPPKCGDPPQVPDHGVLTYNAWDQITYQCDTYAIRSGINSEHKINCKNFTWEELPKSFKCVGSDTYDAHQEWENFLNITLPVLTVLVFLVILCLLATRSDSPFCKICKGSTKEVSY